MPHTVTVSPLTGKPAPKEILIDTDQLEKTYYARLPDTADPGSLLIPSMQKNLEVSRSLPGFLRRRATGRLSAA